VLAPVALVGCVCKTQDGRYLEIPRTLPDWHATSDELTSLLRCEVGKPAIVLVTPHGGLAVRAEDVTLAWRTDAATTLWVSGLLTAGGGLYTVDDPIENMVVRPAGARPPQAEWVTARELGELVTAAVRRDDGPHVELRALYDAEQAGRRVGWSTQNFTKEWVGVSPTDVEKAPKYLQVLGTADLPSSPRRVAFRMARDGYGGTVQELRDDAAALTEGMSDDARKVALGMLDASFEGTAEELLVAAQALSAAPAFHAAA